MKKSYFLTGVVLLTSMLFQPGLNGQTPGPIPLGIKRAQTLTTKGYIDKKTTFNPAALEELLKSDEYVMLISSFEGCFPCELLRTSDVFDIYPISPYYTDYLLNRENEIVPYTFHVSGFPTCIFFDRNGEIVASITGTQDIYGKLDRITKHKEKICEHTLPGVPEDQHLPYFNNSYKASVAFINNDMDGVHKYASAAMEIFPNFYNRYLLYKYYLSTGDTTSANEYKTLALENVNKRDEYIYKNIVKELRQLAE